MSLASSDIVFIKPFIKTDRFGIKLYIILRFLTETPAPDAADALAIGYTHMAATDPLRAHLFRERKYI